MSNRKEVKTEVLKNERDVKTKKKVPLRDVLKEEVGYFGIL